MGLVLSPDVHLNMEPKQLSMYVVFLCRNKSRDILVLLLRIAFTHLVPFNYYYI